MIPCRIEDPNELCPLECSLHSLYSAKGRGEPPQGRTPHFLFETSKRKCAVHGGKEKMSGMIWHLRVKSPKTGVGHHALPKKSGSLLPAALYSFFPEPPPRICRHREQWGTKPNRRISTLVRSASLRTTWFASCFILIPVPLGEGFQRRGLAPVLRPLGREFPKGEGCSPRPLCRWGSRAKSKRPGAFLPGCGAGSFPEKNAPHVPAVGTAPLREQKPAKGHPESAAYSCTGDRPAPGSARRWGWRGCGCLPPPRSGW